LWQDAARGDGAGLAGGSAVCADADRASDAAIAAIRSRIASEDIVIGTTGSGCETALHPYTSSAGRNNPPGARVKVDRLG
jgi:hypothetical protein